MKGVRIPLPKKAPKVETPKKGKGSYRRKPRVTQLCSDEQNCPNPPRDSLV